MKEIYGLERGFISRMLTRSVCQMIRRASLSCVVRVSLSVCFQKLSLVRFYKEWSEGG